MPNQEMNGDQGAPGPVPYERFQQVIGERNQLKVASDKLKAEFDEQARKQKEADARLTQAQAELADARSAADRLKAALGAGLPPELADRLRGGDEEELRADAVRLLAFFKPSLPGVPPPTIGGTAARLDWTTMSAAQIREKREEIMRQSARG